MFAGLTPAEVDLRLRDVTRNGLLRLDDASLVTRMGLVAKLLEAADGATCDAITAGTAAPEQFANAMRQLAEADAYSYATIVEAAAYAELRGRPGKQAVADADADAALTALLAALPSDQASRLQSSWEQTLTSPQERCLAARSFYRGATTLAEPHRATLARLDVQRN